MPQDFLHAMLAFCALLAPIGLMYLLIEWSERKRKKLSEHRHCVDRAPKKHGPPFL
jgi:hypothetical protein